MFWTTKTIASSLIILLFVTGKCAFAEVPPTASFDSLLDDQIVSIVEMSIDDSNPHFTNPNLNLNAKEVSVLGRGIEDKRSGRIIQFICVEPGSEVNGCSKAAFFELNSTKGAYQLISKIFKFDLSTQEVGNLRKYIKKSVKSVRHIHKTGETFNLFHRDGAIFLVSTKFITGKFDDQSGWDWSVSPKQLSHKKYEEMYEAVRSL